jgi:hypothetical protein
MEDRYGYLTGAPTTRPVAAFQVRCGPGPYPSYLLDQMRAALEARCCPILSPTCLSFLLKVGPGTTIAPISLRPLRPVGSTQVARLPAAGKDMPVISGSKGQSCGQPRRQQWFLYQSKFDRCCIRFLMLNLQF